MATDDLANMGCRPASASRVRQDRDEIARHRAVDGRVPIHAPDEGSLAARTIEIVAERDGETAPASLFRRLLCRGFVPRDTEPEGLDHQRILAVRR